jgi:hypothetical protein
LIAVLAGMHPAVLRIVVFVVITTLVLATPSLAFLVLGGAAIWWGPDILTDWHQGKCRSSWTGLIAAELVEARADLASAKLYISNISDELADTRRQAAQWHQELQAARARIWLLEQHPHKGHAGGCGKSEREKLYGRLGLTPDVPDAFLPHIKRAILLSLHPDRHPDGRKAAAQKRFVEAMAVFDSIKDDRQLADV